MSYTYAQLNRPFATAQEEGANLGKNEEQQISNYHWGPAGWQFLHSVTFSYPTNPTVQEKEQFKQFFQQLKYVLPCPSCREHYADGIEKTVPIDKYLDSRESLTQWLWKLHNSVNERLGKPTVSYESVKQKYESMQGICQRSMANDCPPSPSSDNGSSGKCNASLLIWLAVVIFGVVVTVALMKYTKQKK